MSHGDIPLKLLKLAIRNNATQPKPTATADDPRKPPPPPVDDVMSLSDAEVDALSEQELAKLKEDFYAG